MPFSHNPLDNIRVVVDITKTMAIEEERRRSPIRSKDLEKIGGVHEWTIVERQGNRARDHALIDKGPKWQNVAGGHVRLGYVGSGCCGSDGSSQKSSAGHIAKASHCENRSV